MTYRALVESRKLRAEGRRGPPTSGLHFLLTRKHRVVPAKYLFDWATAFHTKRSLFRTVLPTACVSTIFEGISTGRDPRLFETAVRIGAAEWTVVERYRTYKQAKKGHARAVREVGRETGLE